MGAVARYVLTRLATEVTSPVAIWEEGGLRVRVLFYVRLREGAAADFPGNARPAPVTAWPHTAFPFQLNLTVYTGIP